MATFSSGTMTFLPQEPRNFKSGFGFSFDTFAYEKEAVQNKPDGWRG
jgi:hypothetical protein